MDVDVTFVGARIDPATAPVTGEFHLLQLQILATVDQWIDGHADDTDVLEQLATLTVHDDNGTEWTYGPTTGRWYYRNPDNRWVASHPDLHVVEDGG